MEHPSNGEACSGFLALIERPANLNRLSSLLDLLLNLAQLCTYLLSKGTVALWHGQVGGGNRQVVKW